MEVSFLWEVVDTIDSEDIVAVEVVDSTVAVFATVCLMDKKFVVDTVTGVVEVAAIGEMIPNWYFVVVVDNRSEVPYSWAVVAGTPDLADMGLVVVASFNPLIQRCIITLCIYIVERNI